MRKNVFGRKLKRDKNERKALFKGLMSSLVLEERIKTTEAKAKSIKGQVDKLVTQVKKNGVLANNFLQRYLAPNAMDKFISDTAKRFSKRNGGYTRIIKIGRRQDGSLMVFLEWTEGEQKEEGSKVSVSQPVSPKGEVKNETKTKKNHTGSDNQTQD
ncbi:MAG: 50S ribosomal protein L17 [Candidatus Levyibacteriota bacterium]